MTETAQGGPSSSSSSDSSSSGPTPAKPRKVRVKLLLDRSFSMRTPEKKRVDTIEAFNAYLVDQQAEQGEMELTVVMFDHEYGPIIGPKPVREFEPLTLETYEPRGSTCLYGAIGRMIEETDAEQAALPESEREPVLLVVLTDGEENESHKHEWSARFTAPVVRKMLAEHRGQNWKDLYLSATEGDFANEAALGIPKGQSMATGGGGEGVRRGFEEAGAHSTSFRRGSAPPPSSGSSGSGGPAIH